MRLTPQRWLILAGAIHITLTLAIFLVGHFQLLPTFVDEQGSVGPISSFPSDAAAYGNLTSVLANELQTHGVSTWLSIKAPLHCRINSLLFVTIGRLLGQNILAVEPLNLIYYLGVLVCVYLLGRELFNVRAALVASIITAVWPSFLLLSTQFLRDSLSILCLLGLLLLLTLLLTRVLAWSIGILAGVCGSAVVAFFWVIRGNMWNVVILAVGIGLVLLLCRTIRAHKFFTGNTIAMVLVFLTMLLVPPRIESTSFAGHRLPVTPLAIPTASQPAAAENVIVRALRQIMARRSGFHSYRARESDIDADVRFTSIGDIVRFVPRATVIGFGAPFPRMWFQSGTFGRGARLLSGAETLAMYFVYLAAFVAVWRNRKRLEMWLLFLVATIGTIGLGLVVVNAGALYRLRYVFWIMFIIMAADTLLYFDRIYKIYRTSQRP